MNTFKKASILILVITLSACGGSEPVRRSMTEEIVAALGLSDDILVRDVVANKKRANVTIAEQERRPYKPKSEIADKPQRSEEADIYMLMDEDEKKISSPKPLSQKNEDAIIEKPAIPQAFPTPKPPAAGGDKQEYIAKSPQELFGGTLGSPAPPAAAPPKQDNVTESSQGLLAGGPPIQSQQPMSPTPQPENIKTDGKQAEGSQSNIANTPSPKPDSMAKTIEQPQPAHTKEQGPVAKMMPAPETHLPLLPKQGTIAAIPQTTQESPKGLLNTQPPTPIPATTSPHGSQGLLGEGSAALPITKQADKEITAVSPPLPAEIVTVVPVEPKPISQKTGKGILDVLFPSAKFHGDTAKMVLEDDIEYKNLEELPETLQKRINAFVEIDSGRLVFRDVKEIEYDTNFLTDELANDIPRLLSHPNAKITVNRATKTITVIDDPKGHNIISKELKSREDRFARFNYKIELANADAPVSSAMGIITPAFPVQFADGGISLVMQGKKMLLTLVYSSYPDRVQGIIDQKGGVIEVSRDKLRLKVTITKYDGYVSTQINDDQKEVKKDELLAYEK